MFISNEDFYPLFKQDSAKDHFVDDMPTQAEKNVAMTQCIQAWKVSCEIPFEEMMEMTLRKIKALKDSKAFILYLSKVVFAEPSYDLDAETQLREFLISEIHDNIWPDMNEQGNVRDAFLKCPDLMTAVAERIREAREPRTDPDEGA
ncbi:hypothetical protein BU16DRAFT_235420 [Lophium mytilinum]|uniref:Uncharacterized protein n=1 Tax=Lophium mytilinum TaxID=390894 RepID=A0A6A6R5P5_9PEZI|nr:hypothetical protein BU16DRAFT_235420 [Lophium mytilinum]